ncbi:YqaJ viral recombinase family protein [Mycobacterium aquaticum]|uniref:YqaJ viral recombinase domain-containing protein n=1 Tax=Mycobacterium aquaticum TaxID=1927124 RepID=A0A1X0A4F0_9MYCO|nr:YqaJ viral recombinase family protein [Mycobacterium aquaticum]ORA24937.1 hypothetical protein BST13_33760 [Mycobacterium aquaticum]
MTRRTDGVRFYTPRDPEFIKPGSPEWLKVITPSKVAAILGEPDDPVSRYESPFRLWHRMTGRVEPEEPKDAFRMGHRVEPLADGLYRDDRPGWLLSPGEVQAHVDPEKFGFPAIATLDRRGVCGSSRRVVEFKLARNLTDLDVWGDDLKGELPDDYHAQVIALMLFTGWTRIPGELLAVGPYLQHRIYTVDYDRNFAAWIIQKCRRFYESLSSDTPPALDNTTATYECLRALHPEIDRGVNAIVPADEAREFAAARKRLDAAAETFAYHKNVILQRMEQAQYAVVDQGEGAEPIRIAERRSQGTNKKPAFYPVKSVGPADLPIPA